MARNGENYLIIRQGMSSFLGLSKNADPQDLHPSKFLSGRNWICSPRLGEARVRDGYGPIVDNMFVNAFKIMPGARGKLYTPPNLSGATGTGNNQLYDGLQIGASPNSGLYIDDTYTTRVVTFYVYGGTALGITSYTWTFGHGDGQEGAATSVTHTYDAPGTFLASVSGTGSDGRSYSASCAVVIDRRVTPPVEPPGGWGGGGEVGTGGGGGGSGGSSAEAPTANVLANGEEDIELTSAGSVTFSWNTTNATDVFLTLKNGSSVVYSNKRVAASGTQAATVSASAQATIRAVAEDGTEAIDTAQAWVTASSGGGSSGSVTCDLLVEGHDEHYMRAPGPVTLTWLCTNAVSATLNGEDIATYGSTTVDVTVTTSFTITATNGAGNTATDTCIVTVGNSIIGADRRIKIEGVTTAKNGDAVTLTYIVEGKADSEAGWAPMKTTGTITAKAVSDTGVDSGTYSESISLTAEMEHNSTSITLALRTGKSEGTVTIEATLSGVTDGTVTEPTAIHTIAVAMKVNDFTVEVLDEVEGDALATARSTEDTGVEFALKLTAKYTGTSTVNTAFAGIVEITATLTDFKPDYGSPSDDNGEVVMDFLLAHWDSEGNTVTPDGNKIPATAWVDGVCYVTVNVALRLNNPGEEAAQLAYQDITFTAAEVD